MSYPQASLVPALLGRLRAPEDRAQASALTVVGIALLWSYWPTLGQLAERWSIDPQYSHGFLVPLFAAIILWRWKPDRWIGAPDLRGLAILVVSILPRWFTGRMDLGNFDAGCLIGSLLGTVLLIGGRDLLRWTWPAILFLGFMIPLPYSLEQGVAVPLRRLATLAATYVLQTFGYPALAEGNIIRIGDVRLGVIDACSGLGMLMTFFALATAMALVVPGPRLDRWLVVASAAPIAVVANVLRITLTAVAYASFGWQEYHHTIHDVLGWLMMPLALGLLWLEFQFLQLLLVPVADTPLAVSLTPWLDRGQVAAGKSARWS